MNNVSVECLLVAQDVGQHRPRDHILRPIIFGRDVENAVDDAVPELLVGREAWLELWEEGQEVIPVGRGEVRLDGAVLQPRRLVDLLADLSRGAGTRAGVPGGGGGTRTGCLNRPLSPLGSGSGG